MKMGFGRASLLKHAASNREQGGALPRLFAAYVGIALLLFALAAATVLWQTFKPAAPKSSMKRMAASVSAQFFIDMIGMESAYLRRSGESAFSGSKVGGFLAEKLLHVNPFEPKSYLASEMPGMRGTAPASAAAADLPVQAASAGENAGGSSRIEPSATVSNAPSRDGSPSGTDIAGKQPAPQPLPEPQPTRTAVTSPASPEPQSAQQASGEGKAVFVYHSHPRESWAPELKVTSANEAEDDRTNITLVGKRLVDKLQEQGVGSLHSATDYPTKVQGYNWNYSYKYSLQTVKEAFAQNKEIAFLFDIHRDSSARDITTARIGGADYAKVYFIVGKKNANWEQNEAFARRIHDKLEADYPGLSRGIWDKGSGGHAEYNQSVSPNSILIEVGGPFNTLEESYRTADVLAKTIAGLYREAESANAAGPQAAFPPLAAANR